jgi:hypothetical protein
LWLCVFEKKTVVDRPPPPPGGGGPALLADRLDHIDDLAEPSSLEGRRCDVCGAGIELNGAGRVLAVEKEHGRCRLTREPSFSDLCERLEKTVEPVLDHGTGVKLSGAGGAGEPET